MKPLTGNSGISTLLCLFLFFASTAYSQNTPPFDCEGDTTQYLLNNGQIINPEIINDLLSDPIYGELEYDIRACVNNGGKVEAARITYEKRRIPYEYVISIDTTRNVAKGDFRPLDPVELPTGLRDSVLARTYRLMFTNADKSPQLTAKMSIGYVESRQDIRFNFAHTSQIGTMQYSPDGTLLATAGVGSNNIHIWDAKRFLLSQVLREPGLGSVIVRFSPDSKLLGALYANGLFSISYREKMSTWFTSQHYLMDEPFSWISFAFSPDGTKVALARFLFCFWAGKNLGQEKTEKTFHFGRKCGVEPCNTTIR